MDRSKELTPTPLLSERHNGIPARLFNKAQKAKSDIFNISIKAENNRTKIALPQGVSEAAFCRAIEQLKTHLGSEHVELVTKLTDGWYVAHANK